MLTVASEQILVVSGKDLTTQTPLASTEALTEHVISLLKGQSGGLIGLEIPFGQRDDGSFIQIPNDAVFKFSEIVGLSGVVIMPIATPSLGISQLILPMELMVAGPDFPAMLWGTIRVPPGSPRNSELEPKRGPVICRVRIDYIPAPAAQAGNSLSLTPGTGDFAEAPLNAPITFDNFTLEAWIKTDGGGCIYRFDSAVQVTVDQGVSDQGAIHVWGGIQGHATAKTMDGKWHHIAVVREGNTLKIYLDGELKPSDPMGFGISNLTLSRRITIGANRNPNDSTSYFAGMLAELRIWNIARAAQDIKQTMWRTLDPRGQPNLILYYNFDYGSARELTGRGGPLILHGAAKIVPSDVPVPATGGNSLSLDAEPGTRALIPAHQMQLFDFTLEAWIKPSAADRGTVYSCIGAFTLVVAKGALEFIVTTLNGFAKAQASVPDDQPVVGRWHHVAAVRQGDTLRIYLDGRSVQSTTTTTITGSPVRCYVGIAVGGSADGSLARFAGMLTELRIWNVGRQPRDIEQSMRRTLDPRQNASLAFYYNFDDGSPGAVRGPQLQLQGGARIVPSDLPMTPAPT